MDIADGVEEADDKLHSTAFRLLQLMMDEAATAHSEGKVTDDELDTMMARFLDISAAMQAQPKPEDDESDVVKSLKRIRGSFGLTPITDPNG